MTRATLPRMVLTASCVVVLLVTACSGSQVAQPSGGAGTTASAARIQAQPNPVPAGDGLGTTTITWTTGDGRQGQVYVSQNGGDENLFDAGTDGNKDAPWIQTGSTYDFRVYEGTDHKSQLASTKVSRGT